MFRSTSAAHIILLVIIFSIISLPDSTAGGLMPYQIYDHKGKKVNYRKVVRSISSADVILFGELHNNPVCHWLEIAIAGDLYKKGNLLLGAEMFETDDQADLDLYLDGLLSRGALDTAVSLWSNYDTDYAPLVSLAMERGIPLIATNIPRQYASAVYRNGFEFLDSLPASEKQWMADLPIPYDPNLPGYKAMLDMGHGHGGENLPKAQAIRDATMAAFILRHWTDGSRFLHLNGAYHSDNYEGILYFLRLNRPDLGYMTISSVVQEDIGRLAEEHIGKADFIICIDSRMTTSY